MAPIYNLNNTNKHLIKLRLTASFWAIFGLYVCAKFHVFRVVSDPELMSPVTGTICRLFLILLTTVFIWTAKILQLESPDFRRRGSIGALVAEIATQSSSHHVVTGYRLASFAAAQHAQAFGVLAAQGSSYSTKAKPSREKCSRVHEGDDVEREARQVRVPIEDKGPWTTSEESNREPPTLPGESWEDYARYLRRRQKASKKLTLLGVEVTKRPASHIQDTSASRRRHRRQLDCTLTSREKLSERPILWMEKEAADEPTPPGLVVSRDTDGRIRLMSDWSTATATTAASSAEMERCAGTPASSWLGQSIRAAAKRPIELIRGRHKAMFTCNTVISAPSALPLIAHLGMLSTIFFILGSWRVYGAAAIPVVIFVTCGISNLTELFGAIIPGFPLVRTLVALSVYLLVSAVVPFNFPESTYSEKLSLRGSYTAVFITLLCAAGSSFYAGFVAICSITTVGVFPRIPPVISHARRIGNSSL